MGFPSTLCVVLCNPHSTTSHPLPSKLKPMSTQPIEPKELKKRTTRFFWLVFFGLILFFALSITLYARNVLKASPPTPVALQAMQSDGKLTINKTNYGWEFVPAGAVKAGLAFYPGGLVEPPAYAPILRRIASSGYRVALLQVRFNLAVTEQGKARPALEAHPELKWFLAGHSLGGVVASNYADSNPDKVAGLVLWAAYPQNNLSAKSIPTLALFGEKDGVTNKERLEAAKALLPQGTIQITIQGLNHAGFGAYGAQRGDNPATIGLEQGWDTVARLTTGFLDKTIGAQP